MRRACDDYEKKNTIFDGMKRRTNIVAERRVVFAVLVFFGDDAAHVLLAFVARHQAARGSGSIFFQTLRFVRVELVQARYARGIRKATGKLVGADTVRRRQAPPRRNAKPARLVQGSGVGCRKPQDDQEDEGDDHRGRGR